MLLSIVLLEFIQTEQALNFILDIPTYRLCKYNSEL